MSPPRVLSIAVVVSIAMLLLAAPSHAVPEAPRPVLSVQEPVEEALDRHVKHREQALTALLAAAEQHAQVEGVRASRLAALGYTGAVTDLEYVLPLPAFSYRLSAGFGLSGPLWQSTHTGLDFAAPSGTSLVAVADATVTEVSYAGSYGLRTIVTLGDGTDLWYCHQLASLVVPGQSVEIGEPIGMVGSTGNSTGPHLHLEVHPDGAGPVDPADWLASHALSP